jgi:hypothetical protein
LLLVCGTTCLLFVASCSSPDLSGAEGLRGLVGRECTIQFRRDALGAAAALPISPDTQTINGAPIILQGTLQAVRGDWIHLDIAIEYRTGDGSPPRTIHRYVSIPTSSILYVEAQ